MEIETSISWISKLIQDRIYYFRITPEINDFTKIHDIKVMIGSPTQEFEIQTKRQDHRSLLTLVSSMVRAGLFRKGNLLISWDIKKILTYLRYHFDFSPEIECDVIDLKCAESYLARQAAMPTNFNEAKDRSEWTTRHDKWMAVNRDLYTPLVTQVLPAIETRGLACNDSSRSLYINYDLTGHRNGRLICSQPANYFLNVHSLTETVRSKINLCNSLEHQVFVEFDYDHMEVNVLQLVSQDEKLLELLESGQDLYAAIFEVLFDKKCETTECRALIKKIFLPYFFGLQATSATGIFPSLDEAKDAFRRIEQTFPTACKWIREKEQNVKYNPVVEDYFGRIRDFSNEPFYKSRNFFIQSPAAVICMTKFVDMYRELPDNLLFNVHDAYVFSCKLKEVKQIIKVAKSVLEKQSFNGLSLKVKCSVGPQLSKMRKYPI